MDEQRRVEEAEHAERIRGHDKSVGWVLVGGAIALVLGSFLPWATATTFIGEISKNGTSGDGVFTLLAGGLIALLTFQTVKQPIARGRLIVALLVALAAGAICFYDIVDINRVADEAGGSIDVGYGLWIAGGGALASTVASFILILKARNQVAVGPTAPTWAPPPPTGPPTGPPSA